MELAISRHELARAIEAARESLPFEACGLIVGRVCGGGLVEVARIEVARNATTEVAEDRYEVHPEDFVRVDAAARADGLDVVGVWHSHPDSAARPSLTDVERAWPGWSYLIVGRAAHADVHVRSWRIEPSAADASCEVVEEQLVERTPRTAHEQRSTSIPIAS